MKKEANILLIDDNEDVLLAARMLLKQHFTHVVSQTDPRTIPELLDARHFDVVLLDMNFTQDADSGEEGFYWLKQIKAINEQAVIIMITAFGNESTAVETIKAGATDFILKPWNNDKLLATVSSALELSQSRKQLDHIKQVQHQIYSDVQSDIPDIIAQGPVMQQVLQTVEKAAKTDANVLILGESGTGKEVFARQVHAKSPRSEEIFLDVDMGAVSASLFESEMFGHKRGAFTDAKTNRKGRFELASGGSLFLDEIGNLALELQSKLLAALQNRMITPVGDEHPIAFDVRLISATNMPLYDMVRDGSFRQDLLYRINTVEIHLPPLRERLNDIPLLAELYAKSFAKRHQCQIKPFSSKQLDELVSYPWPGNIRELQHQIERAVILSDGGNLELQLHTHTETEDQEHLLISDTLNLEAIEKKAVSKALELNKGNISKAAKALGTTRASLYRKMEKFEL